MHPRRGPSRRQVEQGGAERPLRRASSARDDDAYVLAALRAVARDSRSELPPPPSAGGWIEVAAEQGVLLPLVTDLRRAGHELDAGLTAFARAAAMRALAQRADVSLAGDALSSAGVPWVLVKGPSLTELVYARPHSRESGDIDVLVARTDLRRAVDALTASGVRRHNVDWRQPTWARGCEVPLQMPGGGTLDLHWDLVNRPSMRRAFSLPIHTLLARRTSRVLVGGLDVETLDDLDLVLHVLLHGCMDGCGRLRAFLDAQQGVAWLRSRGWSPADLADRALALDLAAPASLVLRMTATVVDDRVLPWAQALGAGTWWSRHVGRRGARSGRGATEDRLTQRLTRYTSPTSLASVRSLAAYGVDRLTGLGARDRPEAVGPASNDPDPEFDAYLDRAVHGWG